MTFKKYIDFDNLTYTYIIEFPLINHKAYYYGYDIKNLVKNIKNDEFELFDINERYWKHGYLMNQSVIYEKEYINLEDFYVDFVEELI